MLKKSLASYEFSVPLSFSSFTQVSQRDKVNINPED